MGRMREIGERKAVDVWSGGSIMRYGPKRVQTPILR
jgi:hypothetical protein